MNLIDLTATDVIFYFFSQLREINQILHRSLNTLNMEGTGGLGGRRAPPGGGISNDIPGAGGSFY